MRNDNYMIPAVLKTIAVEEEWETARVRSKEISKIFGLFTIVGIEGCLGR